jgi:hypothetical protein
MVSVGTLAFNGLIYLGIVEQQRHRLRVKQANCFNCIE